MSVPIPLRRDFSAARLRGLAKKTKDGPQARRLLTLAAIYDGATRSEAAKIGGVGLQIIRDWVLRFNAQGPDGLLDRKPPGQPSKLNDGQRQAIARMIESGPIPAVHGVVRECKRPRHLYQHEKFIKLGILLWFERRNAFKESSVVDGRLEQFPLSVNRGDSLRAANKILWPSDQGGLRWAIRTICGFG